ncbi:unnamed protein product [Arctogadus glacialis]
MNRRGQAHGQRFAKADYYECDWYYEESTDDRLECSYKGDELEEEEADEGEEEGGDEEEYVCLPQNGKTEEEEEEEEQVLCEGANRDTEQPVTLNLRFYGASFS